MPQLKHLKELKLFDEAMGALIDLQETIPDSEEIFGNMWTRLDRLAHRLYGEEANEYLGT